MQKTKILGWNDIPTGFELKWNFESAPYWLRSLAMLPYLEKYAYPIGVRMGFVWLRKYELSGPIKYDNLWNIEYGPVTYREEIDGGWVSLAFFDNNQRIVQEAEYNFYKKWLERHRFLYLFSASREGRRISAKKAAWSRAIGIFRTDFNIDSPKQKIN